MEHILKTSITMHPPPTQPNGNVVQEEPCWYTGSASSAEIMLLTFPSVVSAEAAFRNLGATRSLQGAQPVSGLGEQAVLSTFPKRVILSNGDQPLRLVKRSY